MARIVRRSWGFYITLIDRWQFKVKLLRFKKGGKLSKQYHTHRAELWLFLSGRNAGNWAHIEREEIHTYYATIKTWVLEIQYGEKCEEEDIVRV